MCLLKHNSLSLRTFSLSRLPPVRGPDLRLTDAEILRTNHDFLEIQATQAANLNHQLLNSRDHQSTQIYSHNAAADIRQSNEYLDIVIFGWTKNWLDKSLVWKSVRDLMKILESLVSEKTISDQEIMLQQRPGENVDVREVLNQTNQDISEEHDFLRPTRGHSRHERPRWLDLGVLQNEGENIAKLKLIRVLRTSRLNNLFLILSHFFIIFQAASDQRLYFQDWFEQPAILGQPSSGQVEDHINSTSWSKKQVGSIRYYLLTVNLLDFLNSLYWRHSKESIVPIVYSGHMTSFELRKVSLWRTLVNILLSPRLLFQTLYASLFVAGGPLFEASYLAVGLFNCLTQLSKHMYNFHRVRRYLDIIESGGDSQAEGGTDEQTPCDQQLMDSEGWSNWPCALSTCTYELGNSICYNIERLTMQSQILGFKLAIFTVLFHLDGQAWTGSKIELLSLAVLVEAVFAMYSTYDKYYLRYYSSSTTC